MDGTKNGLFTAILLKVWEHRCASVFEVWYVPPPPLRARSVFDGKKVLLIDPHQPTRNARATVFRSHGIGVDATDSLEVAQTLWRTKLYDLILLDPRGHLPGEARDFYLEIKHASPGERVPTEFVAAEREPQQWAETVKRLFNAA
jgi:CheY-like chemotaxis protein